MNRRTMFGSLVAAVACAFGVKAAAPGSDSDYYYASLESNFLCIPYLNGRPVRGAVRGNAREGWLDVMMMNQPETTTRVYGHVQLMKRTPERYKEFLLVKHH